MKTNSLDYLFSTEKKMIYKNNMILNYITNNKPIEITNN